MVRVRVRTRCFHAAATSRESVRVSMPGWWASRVGPEQLAEQIGQPLQGGEVVDRLTFGQVVDQHVPHRPAGDAITVDQLSAGRLAGSGEYPQRRRRGVAEAAEATQQLV